MSRNDSLPFSEQMKGIILFRGRFQGTQNEIVIKPLHLPRDISLIHQWANQPRAKQFWQMEGPVEDLYLHYEDFLKGGKGYSLMCFQEDRPVAQIDYYKAGTDEIGAHFDCCETDFGIHLLMGNYERPVPHLSRDVMITALAFLFTLDIGRIVGEPDAGNNKANKLVSDVGFRFIKKIQMSYKTANLYMFDKLDFIKRYGNPKK